MEFLFIRNLNFSIFLLFHEMFIECLVFLLILETSISLSLIIYVCEKKSESKVDREESAHSVNDFLCKWHGICTYHQHKTIIFRAYNNVGASKDQTSQQSSLKPVRQTWLHMYFQHCNSSHCSIHNDFMPTYTKHLRTLVWLDQSLYLSHMLPS